MFVNDVIIVKERKCQKVSIDSVNTSILTKGKNIQNTCIMAKIVDLYGLAYK